MKRKWLIGGAILVVIIIIVAFAVGTHGNDSVKVTTTHVTPRSIKSSVLASGQFAYKDHVELRSQVSGQIVSLPIEEGDTVKKNEVVLQIDPKTYQANVDQQKAQVALQEDQIRSAKLKRDNLKREWQRQTKLYNKGLVDANSYDQITNQYEVAKVTLASARKSLSLAQAQLDFSREQLAKTVIRSPLNGIVTSLNVKVGESVIPGTTNIPGSTLMTIGDASKLQAVVNVDEADIAHIAPGEKAEIISSAYPDMTLHGKVRFVAPSATAMPGQQGQGFEVKIRIQQTAKVNMRPGMTCRAQIFTQGAQNALAVPVGAILFGRASGRSGSQSKSLFSTDNAYVFVLENGKAKKVPVTIGISSDLWQEIKSGIKKGDEVITGPYNVLHSLADGMVVQAIHTPAPVPQSG